MKLLDTLTRLSREFGGPSYVLGGGGNTSAKDRDTLWVKPSGTTLAGLTPQAFVALDRSRIADLYALQTPRDKQAREALVKATLQNAVRPDSPGRPSVETPLHNAFAAVFVVHTHPALINGLTCAMDGENACRALFPDALWQPYADPGYTLSMQVREGIAAYKASHGQDPEIVFLQNHGVFIAADDPERVRRLHARVMGRLEAHYRDTELAPTLPEGRAPEDNIVAKRAGECAALFGNEAAFLSASGVFAVSRGPLSPDHMVYARSFPLVGEPNPEIAARYRDTYGYAPRVLVCPEGIYGMGRSNRNAKLALAFARDAALVARLAGAFGGVRYLGDEERLFIENWEVESYRSRVAENE